MLLISRIFIGPGTAEARKYKCVVAPGNSDVQQQEGISGLVALLFVCGVRPNTFTPKQSGKCICSSAEPEKSDRLHSDVLLLNQKH